MNTRNAAPALGEGRAPLGLPPAGLTSRQAGTKRSPGAGSPWEAACFQPESSPLARARSQAEGPGGRGGSVQAGGGPRRASGEPRLAHVRATVPRTQSWSLAEGGLGPGDTGRAEAVWSGWRAGCGFPGQEGAVETVEAGEAQRAGVGSPGPRPHGLSPPGNQEGLRPARVFWTRGRGETRAGCPRGPECPPWGSGRGIRGSLTLGGLGGAGSQRGRDVLALPVHTPAAP